MKRILIIYGSILGVSLTILFSNQLLLHAGWNTISIYGGILILIGFAWGYAFTRRQKQMNKPNSSDLKNEPNVKINAQELLSKREMEVLAFLPSGKSNKELGQVLFVSENTIKTHLKQIYAKMDVRNRVEAIEKAKSLNWIEKSENHPIG